MFCSNCGKTLKPDAVSCQHCGAMIGDTRFDGGPYTAAQTRTKPGEAVRLVNNHTRTTYTGIDAQEEGDVYSRTTYRAAFSEETPAAAPVKREETEDLYGEAEDETAVYGESGNIGREEPAPQPPKAEAPEKPRKEPVAPPPETPASEEAFNPDDIRARKIEINKQRGISDDVRQYMATLGQNRDRRETPAPAKGGFTFAAFARKKNVENFEDVDTQYVPGDQPKAIVYKDEQDAFNPDVDPDPLDADAEEYEEDDPPRRARASHGKIPQLGNIAKYAIAAFAVVLVLVLVIVGLSYITGSTKKSPIDGVSYDLYQSGIQLIQSHGTEVYRSNMLNQYSGGLTVFYNALKTDLDAVGALTADGEYQNDQRFIDALKTIQESVNNSLTNDILSLSDTTKTNEVKQAEADARWKTCTDLIAAAAAATSSAQLDAIIKGEKVEIIQQATPEPAATATPAPYVELAKGTKSNAVTQLQTRLYELGYMTSEIDGDFGSKTQTAVKLFQQTIGLEATGIADVTTQTRLFAADAPAYTAAN